MRTLHGSYCFFGMTLMMEPLIALKFQLADLQNISCWLSKCVFRA